MVALHEVWDPRQFDEIVISTLPTGVSRWFELHLPRRVEKLTGVSVEHVVAAALDPAARTGACQSRSVTGAVAALGHSRRGSG